jgi:hypothetical protein
MQAEQLACELQTSRDALIGGAGWAEQVGKSLFFSQMSEVGATQ